MTSTVATPDLKVDRDPMRILTITANLLPVEITDARREHKLRWIVAAVLVVVLAALGFWDYSARQQTSDQQAALTKAQARVNSLQASIADPKYAALSKAKSDGAAISSELTKLMATDVAWYEVVPTLRTTAQAAGVTLTNITATLTTASSAASATTTATSGTSGTDAGSISLTGTATDKSQIATFLDALGKVPGLTNPFLTNVNGETSQNQFSMTVTFTSALYSGRYTPAKTTGGK
jgi:Tfp pilus assembly protein PilN